MRVRIPYLVVKRRRSGAVAFYWQPSAELRAHGWQQARLPDGQAAAEAAARARNAEVDAWRAGQGAAPASASGPAPGTVAALIAAYRAGRDCAALKPRTRRDYEYYLELIERWAGAYRCAQITTEMVEQLYETARLKAPSKANYLLAVLRLLFAWGVKRNLAPHNPGTGVRRRAATPAARAIWSPAMLEHFIAAADAAGRPSVGTAAMLTYWWGQREGDILSLPAPREVGQALRLQQSKTGAAVTLPLDLVPQLRQRLTDELQRHRAAGRLTRTLIASEATGRPYTARRFARLVEGLRGQAAAAAAAAGDAETASLLGDAHFQRLRATAVVRLLEAGCDSLQVSAMTGHSPRSVDLIARHYMVRTTALARAAVQRRVDAEGAR